MLLSTVLTLSSVQLKMSRGGGREMVNRALPSVPLKLIRKGCDIVDNFSTVVCDTGAKMPTN